MDRYDIADIALNVLAWLSLTVLPPVVLAIFFYANH